MRAFAAFVALALTCFVPAASAQTTGVSLGPSEGMIIAIPADGGVQVLSRTNTPTALSQTEQEMMPGLRGNPAAMGQNVMPMIGDVDSASSEAVEPNIIKLRFLLVQPHDSVLMIENGYDQGFTYRARIWVNDQASPTDVCLVMPSRHGSEHWPYAIDRIELSDLKLTPWRDGDPVTCE